MCLRWLLILLRLLAKLMLERKGRDVRRHYGLFGLLPIFYFFLTHSNRKIFQVFLLLLHENLHFTINNAYRRNCPTREVSYQIDEKFKVLF